MRWIRSHTRFGSRLALLALALQLVLSFGHIHTEDLRPVAAVSQAVNGPPASIPSDRHHPGLPDDYCPICTAASFAAVGLVWLPPVILVPDDYIQMSHAPTRAQGISIARYVLFRTRAPPLA